MLLLFNDSEDDLTQNSIQTIFRLLNIAHPPDITGFLNNPEEEKSFYYLFFEVLIENNIPCALTIDWKWHPEDLFWQLERYFTKNTIKLIHSEWVASDESYQIEYEFDSTHKTLSVAFDNPHTLLDSLSPHLKDTTFISIDFLEDRYSWLIVPKIFDSELFRRLTGSSSEKPTPKQVIPPNFAKNYRQSEKIFFRPSLMYVDDNGAEHALSDQAWAGRILPGQTVEEGIAAELKAELHYSGRFDYSYGGFEGVFKDRKGNAIKRYNLTIYLFDDPLQSQPAAHCP